MITIKNSIIPFGSYNAINLFGIVFYKKNMSYITKNHEYIHTKQMRELLYIPFYIIYCLEYLIRLLILQSHKKAYRAVSFEKEAYSNQQDSSYKESRKPYSWIKYL
jgi:hypothetical protein